MNWYHSDGVNRFGPISEAELIAARQGGVIHDETLVWREGLTNWITYREAFAAPAAPQGSPIVPPQIDPAALGLERCCECAKTFPSAEMIRHGQLFVCANCKPVFLQKLTEGVASYAVRGKRQLPVDPAQLTQEILSRGYTLNVRSCANRGIQAVKARYGVCLGASLLIMLCNQAAGVVPILGIFVTLAVAGALMAGLNQFYINVIRGETATVALAFSGFQTGFWRYAGTYLSMMVMVFACMIPAIVFGIIRSDNDAFAGEPLFWVLLIAGVSGMVYLGVAFAFGMYLVTDLRLSPWAALQVSRRVVTRRWLSVFLVMLVGIAVMMAGIVLCLIGIIFTLPFFYGIMAQAYEDIFGVQEAKA